MSGQDEKAPVSEETKPEAMETEPKADEPKDGAEHFVFNADIQ